MPPFLSQFAMLSKLAPIPFLLLAACSAPTSYPTSNGSPDSRFEDAEAQKIASELCRLSDGPFPNWPRLSEFEQWLSPSEVRAVKRVDAALRADIPKKQMPKYDAIARFIAQNTICNFQFRENDKNSNAINFVFEQKTPTVPFAPELSPSDDLKALEDAWLAEFNKAWKGDHRTRIVNIVLKKDDDNNWKIISNVEKNYANPLDKRDAENNFFKELELGQLEHARLELVTLCNYNKSACDDYRALFDQAKQQFALSAAFARDFLSIDSQKLTYIAQKNILPYTAATLDITNNSDLVVSNIIMTTNEPEPQFCILQNTRQKRGDDPVTLMPHASAKVYCALAPETKPFAKLDWVDFNTSSSQN